MCLLVGTLSVLLGDGNGAFAAAPDLAVDGWPSAVAAGDFNGDGKVDLAVTVNSSLINNASVAILAGTGAGTFAPATVFVLDRVNGANLTALVPDGCQDWAGFFNPCSGAGNVFTDTVCTQRL